MKVEVRNKLRSVRWSLHVDVTRAKPAKIFSKIKIKIKYKHLRVKIQPTIVHSPFSIALQLWLHAMDATFGSRSPLLYDLLVTSVFSSFQTFSGGLWWSSTCSTKSELDRNRNSPQRRRTRRKCRREPACGQYRRKWACDTSREQFGE